MRRAGTIPTVMLMTTPGTATSNAVSEENKMETKKAAAMAITIPKGMDAAMPQLCGINIRGSKRDEAPIIIAPR